MDEQMQQDTAGMDTASAAVAAANGDALNSVEPDLQRVHALPQTDDTGAGSEAPAAIPWLDADALEAVKRRRQQDLAAAGEALETPAWASAPTASGSQAQRADDGQPRAGDQEPSPSSPRSAVDGEATPEAAAKGLRFSTDPLDVPPDAIAKRYLQAGNRYFLRDGSQQVAFEDRGARMVTAHNRPDIAESMAEMALAKGWSNIRVKGHEDFRRAVWLEAATRGITVTGYTPDEADRARLAERMSERMTNRVEADVARGAAPASSAADRSTSAQAPREAGVQSGDRSVDKPGALAGELVKHGSAPYQHEAGGSNSYFVTFRNAEGEEKTVWGIDLARAIKASGAQRGQQIALENLGQQPVTIDEPVRADDGSVTGTRPKDVVRNVWNVSTVDPAPQQPGHSQPRTSGPAGVSAAPAAPSTVDMPLASAKPDVSPATAPVAAVKVPDLSGMKAQETFVGELVAHGRAPYQNQPGAQTTYFATLRGDDARTVTVWGADLERALAASQAQPGDRVSLANYGRQRITADAPTVNERGEITGSGRRTIERYVWGAQIEARARQPAAELAAQDDPQRRLHLAVLSEAMRAQGFSEKSITKTQARAGTVLDRLAQQGVVVPPPRAFDPAGRVQQPRSRGTPSSPTVAPEVERTLLTPSPVVPSR